MKCSVANQRPNAAALQGCWASPWASYWGALQTGHGAFVPGTLRAAFVRLYDLPPFKCPLVLGHNAKVNRGQAYKPL